jgi:hypothetical protein
VRGGAPRAAGALFFGDSITYGIGLQNEELFTNLVEARLNAAQPAPGWCVMNFAQPGYGFEQSLAVAREEIPRQRPAVVLFEFWAIGRSYRMLGDSAYDVDAYRLRGAGFPAVRYGWLIPNALNRLAVHALGGLPFFCADLRGHRLEATLPPLLRSVGARGVYFLATPLHQPFARSITDAFQVQWTGAVLGAARRSGVTAIRLEEALRAEDYLALRQDPCCHFNAAGHRAIAAVLARAALE